MSLMNIQISKYLKIKRKVKTFSKIGTIFENFSNSAFFCQRTVRARMLKLDTQRYSLIIPTYISSLATTIR